MLRAISLRYGTLQELRQLLHTARARPIFTSTSFLAKSLPPRLVLKEEDIQEAFVHGSGPGGQKIVSSRPKIPPLSLQHFYQNRPASTFPDR